MGGQPSQQTFQPDPSAAAAAFPFRWSRLGSDSDAIGSHGESEGYDENPSPLDDAPVWKCTTIAAWPVGLTAASTRSCAIPSFAKHPMVETDGHGESSRAFAMHRARGQLAAASAERTEPRSK